MAQTQALYRNSSAATSEKTKIFELPSWLEISRRLRVPRLVIADFVSELLTDEVLDIAGLVVVLAVLCMVAA